MSGWRPPHAFRDVPHAILTVTSADADGLAWWVPSSSAELREFAGVFLQDRLSRLGEADLSSEANFLHVVFGRAPAPGDSRVQVGPDTPIVEFGFGGPPVSPEEWPLVELRALLMSAVQELLD